MVSYPPCHSSGWVWGGTLFQFWECCWGECEGFIKVSPGGHERWQELMRAFASCSRHLHSCGNIWATVIWAWLQTSHQQSAQMCKDNTCCILLFQSKQWFAHIIISILFMAHVIGPTHPCICSDWTIATSSYFLSLSGHGTQPLMFYLLLFNWSSIV